METKTHWKKHFDYRFVSAEELKGETTLTIKNVIQDEAFSGKYEKDKDGKRIPIMEPVTVLKFENAEKGMVLNKTNAKAISTTLKSPFLEDWVGKQITIYPTKVSAFGQEVDAIRVKIKMDIKV